jgi:hypothetical protein
VEVTMPITKEFPSHLTDGDLAAQLTRLACSARHTTADLIAHLAEFEARRLHLAAGFGSLFLYCTQVLRLSEHEAYNRIEAAHLARRYPRVLELLTEGALNLTTARLLSPHLTDENHEQLLTDASGLSKNDVQKLVARHFPKPDVACSIRKVPTPGSSSGSPAPESAVANGDACGSLARPEQTTPDQTTSLPDSRPRTVERKGGGSPPLPGPMPPPSRRDVVRPLAEDRYEVRFTASAGTCEKLQAAKDLLRHAIPGGDTGEIIDRALTALLEDLAKRKFAATSRPRTSAGTEGSSRHVPAAVKRVVWARDDGRCSFVATNGRRCGTRSFIEFHHVHPYGVGGPPTTGNIELRCRAHNAYEADLFYGAGCDRPTGAGAGRNGDPTGQPGRDGDSTGQLGRE